MSSTREIDAFDTLVGIFTSYFARALIWGGIIIAGTAIGLLGLWVHELAMEAVAGTHKSFLSHVTIQSTYDAFVDLPQYWALLCITSILHPVGLVCVAITVFGSFIFIATDLRTEEIFFVHLIASPWAAMSLTKDFPFFALIIWFLWSGLWAFLWYKRWKDGEELLRKEEEYRGATGYRFSMLANEPARFPEIRFKDPNPVSEPLRLPSTEELRASLNLPEPPPPASDIDTCNLR